MHIHLSKRLTFHFNILVSLTGLLTVNYILSLRQVWELMNRYVDDVLPFGEYSFAAAFGLVILLNLAGLIPLFVRIRKRTPERNYPPALLIFLLLQLVIYLGLLAFIYPETASLYLEMLPGKLMKNGVLPLAIILSFIPVTLFVLRIKPSAAETGLIAAYGLLIVLILVFAYMSLTVRTPLYHQNRLDKALSHQNVPQIDPREAPSFPEGDDRLLKPDFSLELDTEYGGVYWMAGDLTGDGQVEIITSKYYVEVPDINHVVSLAVQNLEGERLWHWESPLPAPEGLGMGRGSSIAMAVYNLKEEEENDQLLMATDGILYQFDGKSGDLLKRVEIGPVDAGDGLNIANLRGKGRRDVLIKDAYHTIWAFDENLDLLWKKENPGGRALAHRLAVYDLNNDGIDEIISGSAILWGDGRPVTLFESDTVNFWYGSHVDGIVPIPLDDEWNIAITYCDGRAIGLYDTEGKALWEITGNHYEYLVGGYFFPDDPDLQNQFQLITKVHYKEGDPQLMVNQDGDVLGQFQPGGPAFALDWTGDGWHEMVFAYWKSIYSGFEKKFELQLPGGDAEHVVSMRISDFIGRSNGNGGYLLQPDGIPDIAVRTEIEERHYMHIYLNRNGKKPENYVYPGIGWEEAASYFTKYYDYGLKP